jgi:hypothetical protein
MTFPVVLGHGERLFNDSINEKAFTLANPQVFATGVVAQTYEPAIQAGRTGVPTPARQETTGLLLVPT